MSVASRIVLLVVVVVVVAAGEGIEEAALVVVVVVVGLRLMWEILKYARLVKGREGRRRERHGG